MNAETSKVMFALLRSATCNTLLTNEEKLLYTEDMLTEMEDVSKKHDVINILAFGLKKNGLLNNENKSLESEMAKAIYRYTKLDYELENICNTLENAQIAFIPLKGSVIREYYSEPWLRTSADIDVLIHKSDIETAKSCLINSLKYKYAGTREDEISFYTLSGCHIELHISLTEKHLSNSATDILNSVWDTAVKCIDYEYWYKMTNELFYFHHIAHMAKHFIAGGCGIRPFIDVYLLKNSLDLNKDKCDLLFENGNLMKFKNTVELLTEVWFNNAEYNDTTYQMQEYILRGGVYGTHENDLVVKRQKLGGQLHYMLYKIFLPYKELKHHYPILEKHRWLTPIMEIRRWCRHIFVWHLDNAMKELKCNNSISKDISEVTKELFKEIGL